MELERRGVAAAAAAHRAVGCLRDEPLFPTLLLRERARLGMDTSPDALFAAWRSKSLGTVLSPLRYRWTISARYFDPVPPYIGERSTWRPWRPAEAEEMTRDRDAFVARLVVPIVLAETVDYLGDLASGQDASEKTREEARGFLRETMPALRADGAFYVAGRHAWGDTFALWAFARRRAALRVLYANALAIAEGYADSARQAGGILLGSRFPFHDRPIVSGSAQLATGLLALGLYPELVGRLARYVGACQRVDGGWGDADGPAELLSTLVAADLLMRLDPRFDPGPVASFVLARQRPDGFWRAMGPEAAWLTVELARLLDDAQRPFATRFRWPELARVNRDRRTGLPFYAYLADLAALCAEVDGLGTAHVEIAFTDLARFGEFNNRAGMAMGDEVLRLYASELRALPDAVAIRDGGDEFIVMGAPTATGLRERLERFRTETWPAALRQAFGDDVEPVAPRILIADTTAGRLVAAREALGRAIGPWKTQVDPVPATGALADLGKLA